LIRHDYEKKLAVLKRDNGTSHELMHSDACCNFLITWRRKRKMLDIVFNILFRLVLVSNISSLWVIYVD